MNPRSCVIPLILVFAVCLASCNGGGNTSTATTPTATTSAVGSQTASALSQAKFQTGLAWGRVLTDTPMSGATVVMRTLDGSVLAPAVVVDDQGNFFLHGSSLPSNVDFIVYVTPAAGSKWNALGVPLQRYVSGYQQGQLLHVNLLTTIESLIVQQVPGLTLAQVNSAIVSRFGLRTGTDVGAGVEETPRSRFLHSRYYAFALQNGGLAALVKADVAKVVTALSTRGTPLVAKSARSSPRSAASVTPTPTPTPTPEEDEEDVEAADDPDFGGAVGAEYGSTETITPTFNTSVESAQVAVDDAAVDFVDDTEFALDVTPETAVVGWLLCSMLNNLTDDQSTTATELQTISNELSTLSTEITDLSTNISTLAADDAYQTAVNDMTNNVVTPIDNLIYTSATSLQVLGLSFTGTNTPSTVSSSIQTLSTDTLAYYSTNSIDVLQNYMLGLNNVTNVPQELQKALTGSLGQSYDSSLVYGLFPLRSNVTGVATGSGQSGIDAIVSNLNYYVGAEEQALTLLVEAAHAESQPAPSIAYLQGAATQTNSANNLVYNMAQQANNSIPFLNSDYYFCDMTNFLNEYTDSPTKSANQAVLYYSAFQGATYVYEQSNGDAVTSYTQVEPSPTVTFGLTTGTSSDDQAAHFLVACNNFSATGYAAPSPVPSPSPTDCWRLMSLDEAKALRALALQADSSSVTSGLTMLGFSGLSSSSDWIWVQDVDREKIVASVYSPNEIQTTYTHPVHAYNIVTGSVSDNNDELADGEVSYDQATITSDFSEYQYLLTRDALPSLSSDVDVTKIWTATGLRPTSLDLSLSYENGETNGSVKILAKGDMIYAGETYASATLNDICVAFYSSDPTVVEVSNTPGTAGKLTIHPYLGTTPGTVTITATCPGMIAGTYASTTLTSTYSLRTDASTSVTSDYTVLDGTLYLGQASVSSIAVTPRNRILSTSSSTQFYATAFYNNSTAVDVTSNATWSVKYTDGTTPASTDINFDSVVPGQLNVGSHPAETNLEITATYDGTTSTVIYVDVDETGTN